MTRLAFLSRKSRILTYELMIVFCDCTSSYQFLSRQSMWYSRVIARTVEFVRNSTHGMKAETMTAVFDTMTAVFDYSRAAKRIPVPSVGLAACQASSSGAIAS
jgi:hypothetical protein